MTMLFGAACFAATAYALIHSQTLEPVSVVVILALVALETVRHRFLPVWPLVLAQGVVAVGGGFVNPHLLLLIPVVLQGAAALGAWLLVVGVLTAAAPLVAVSDRPLFVVAAAGGIAMGALWRQWEQGRQAAEAQYDNERRLRYELEGTKNRLLQSLHEQVQLAEAHERSRIARDIHDHVGHGMAGVLMQLQAAKKLLGRDRQRAEVMLEDSIQRLAESLTVMRETVHNLRPKAKLGAEYLKSIVESFQFSAIHWHSTGDLSQVPGQLLEIIGVVMKEALTNASRHSQAANVTVQVDVYDSFVRLLIEDDGVGVEGSLQEGMGLTGIRERVQNLGGSVSLRSHPGFMIVCILPLGQQGQALPGTQKGGEPY